MPHLFIYAAICLFARGATWVQGGLFAVGCHAPGAPGKGYLSAPFFQSPLNYLTRPWGGLEGPHRHMECLFVP